MSDEDAAKIERVSLAIANTHTQGQPILVASQEHWRNAARAALASLTVEPTCPTCGAKSPDDNEFCSNGLSRKARQMTDLLKLAERIRCKAHQMWPRYDSYAMGEKTNNAKHYALEADNKRRGADWALDEIAAALRALRYIQEAEADTDEPHPTDQELANEYRRLIDAKIPVCKELERRGYKITVPGFYLKEGLQGKDFVISKTTKNKL